MLDSHYATMARVARAVLKPHVLVTLPFRIVPTSPASFSHVTRLDVSPCCKGPRDRSGSEFWLIMQDLRTYYFVHWLNICFKKKKQKTVSCIHYGKDYINKVLQNLVCSKLNKWWQILLLSNDKVWKGYLRRISIEAKKLLKSMLTPQKQTELLRTCQTQARAYQDSISSNSTYVEKYKYKPLQPRAFIQLLRKVTDCSPEMVLYKSQSVQLP